MRWFGWLVGGGEVVAAAILILVAGVRSGEVVALGVQGVLLIAMFGLAPRPPGGR